MMIINLKQNEIIIALKQYISQQGINLTNKEIQVSFTAGRKDSGISAELTIEEGVGGDIPGFTEPEYEAPVLSIVLNEPLDAEVRTNTPVLDTFVPLKESEPVVTSESSEPVKTTSLFG